MTTFQEFHDPRLAALYDDPADTREDLAFFRALAEELDARTVVDLGCGTGVLAVDLARAGARVTGIDPAAAMLDVARARPGGNLVRWIEGDASAYDGPPVDLVVMTAHVAQVIADDEAWRDALRGAASILRPGGSLAFESRNPDARAWLRWTPEATRRRRPETPVGPVETWWTVTDVAGDLVRTEIRYRFERTGEKLVSSNALRFRSHAALTASVEDAGFTVEHVYGDWDRTPVAPTSPELIFMARRAAGS